MQMAIDPKVSRKRTWHFWKLGPDVGNGPQGETTGDRSGASAAYVERGLGRRMAQMREANRQNAPFAVIVGKDELAAGVVQIKEMSTGEQTEVPVEAAVHTVEAVDARAPEETVPAVAAQVLVLSMVVRGSATVGPQPVFVVRRSPCSSLVERCEHLLPLLVPQRAEEHADRLLGANGGQGFRQPACSACLHSDKRFFHLEFHQRIAMVLEQQASKAPARVAAARLRLAVKVISSCS